MVASVLKALMPGACERHLDSPEKTYREAKKEKKNQKTKKQTFLPPIPLSTRKPTMSEKPVFLRTQLDPLQVI